MTKVIRIDFRAGGVWETPADWIAESRADYYAQVDTECDSGAEFETVKKQEIEYALSAEGEDDLYDYLINNFSWVEIAPRAVQVAPPPPFDYDREWGNRRNTLITVYDK